jgi:hypothetical protein
VLIAGCWLRRCPQAVVAGTGQSRTRRRIGYQGEQNGQFALLAAVGHRSPQNEKPNCGSAFSPMRRDDCLRFGTPDSSALVGCKGDGGLRCLPDQPRLRGRTHDIGSLFAQTEHLASALNKRSTTTSNRVAFVSLAHRNDEDPALPAVERVPRRRHATIGLPGRDGSGRANIA